MQTILLDDFLENGIIREKSFREQVKKLNLNKFDFILASIHREENLDINDNLSKIMYSLDQLSITYKKKIIFSAHPRTKIKLSNNKIKYDSKRIILSDPFGYFDYIKLAKNSFLTISDSGTIVEDCATYGFKAIMLRDTNERPEGFDNGNLIMVSPNSDYFIKAVNASLSKEPNESLNQYSDEIYVSNKILNIVLSYTGFVNKYTWNK